MLAKTQARQPSALTADSLHGRVKLFPEMQSMQGMIALAFLETAFSCITAVDILCGLLAHNMDWDE